MPYSERFLLRSESELLPEAEESLPDLDEVVLPDLPSFLEDEPDLAFVVDDLLVEPVVVLLPVLPLFWDEPELPIWEESLLLPDLFEVLPDDDEEVGLRLLDELPDMLEFCSVF